LVCGDDDFTEYTVGVYSLVCGDDEFTEYTVGAYSLACDDVDEGIITIIAATTTNTNGTP